MTECVPCTRGVHNEENNYIFSEIQYDTKMKRSIK